MGWHKNLCLLGAISTIWTTGTDGLPFSASWYTKYPNKIKPSVKVSPRFDGCLRELVAYENPINSSLTEKTDFKRQEAKRWSVLSERVIRRGRVWLWGFGIWIGSRLWDIEVVCQRRRSANDVWLNSALTEKTYFGILNRWSVMRQAYGLSQGKVRNLRKLWFWCCLLKVL